MLTYRVVPFVGKINANGSAAEVSSQLETLINAHAVQGWKLDQIQAVNIEITPGCLAGLLGAEKTYVRFDQVIFRNS